ncbi:glycosyltransferase family 2 protein [Salisediminibacterium halotolerans]|uniref:glycosyltransferase family 2 protein n=1 Tax=Salisediminibacterium halotolerans TaxID=517425 RepID=UPI001649BBAB|nr:glycosyltransferase [Salisediminibacterium halotolerans]
MNTASDSPLVSVITPTYFAERFIGQTIDSVLAQTYSNWEMIITDDASKDGTINIIKKYEEDDSRIKLVALETNHGAAHARNISLQQARGRFIAFLDSDDMWFPEKLEIQLYEMLRRSWAFSFTSYITVDENGNDIDRTIQAPKQLSYADMLKHNDIGCLTVMIDQQQTGERYMKPIKARQDYVLWLELAKSGFPAYGINRPLAKYRELTKSLSSNKLEMAKLNWRVYREVEELSLIKSLYYFSHFAVNKLTKYSS